MSLSSEDREELLEEWLENHSSGPGGDNPYDDESWGDDPAEELLELSAEFLRAWSRLPRDQRSAVDDAVNGSLDDDLSKVDRKLATRGVSALKSTKAYGRDPVIKEAVDELMTELTRSFKASRITPSVEAARRSQKK